MREITSYDEFQVGKQYKRVTSGSNWIVTIEEKRSGLVYVKGVDGINGGRPWEIMLGKHANYYHIDDILSDSEEL